MGTPYADLTDVLSDKSYDFVTSRAPEVQLFLLLMQAGESQTRLAKIDEILSTHTLRWDDLIQLARKHGGIPLFYKALKDKHHSLVPQNVKTRLQNDFHSIGLLIAMQTRVMKHLIADFESVNMPILFFKGIQLGAEVYGNPIWRKPGDLDVLIHEVHYAPAKERLLQLGFDTRLTPAEEKEQLARQRQLTFYGKTVDVDVHFSLEQRSFIKMSYAATFDSQDVWKRATHVMLDDVKIPCLAPEDQFCLLCVHSAKHGWYRMYMLTDLAAYMTNIPLNWQKIAIRAKRIKAERMLSLNVLLVHRLFHIPIPDVIQRLIAKDNTLLPLSDQIMERLFDEDAEEKSFQFHRIQAGLFPRWSEKAMYLGYVTAEHWKRRWSRKTVR